jgi:hypothetical protein
MKCVLTNIWAFSCLYMGLFVPSLNGPCSCPPMGRDLGPNPARYNGPCRPGTKLFRAVPCLGRAFFSVLRAGPSGPAQMYTYTGRHLQPRFFSTSRLLNLPEQETRMDGTDSSAHKKGVNHPVCRVTCDSFPVRLVGCIWSDQAHQMQFSFVWLPDQPLQPGSRDAKIPLEPGSRDT